MALNKYVVNRIREMYGKEVLIVLGGPSIDNDINEQHNVYDQYPEKVKELTSLLEKIKSTPANQKIKIQE